MSEYRIILAAMTAGLAAAAIMPAGFRLDAWLFGGLLGIGQSTFGLVCYRAALQRKGFAFGPALASGLIRVAIVLAALALVLRAGYPAAPFVWSTLAVYFAMMAAEIVIVAKRTAHPQEAR